MVLYVLNDPVRNHDALGLKPGDPYDSPDDAAVAAMEFVAGYVCYQCRRTTPITINANEVGGRIYYDPQTGKYTYTKPIFTSFSSVDVGNIPADTLGAGVYHIHNGGSPLHDADKGKVSGISRLYYILCSSGVRRDVEGAKPTDTIYVYTKFKDKSAKRVLKKISTAWDGVVPTPYYYEGGKNPKPVPAAEKWPPIKLTLAQTVYLEDDTIKGDLPKPPVKPATP